MKRKTKWKIRRYLKISLPIIGTVFAIGGFIAKFLPPFPSWIWPIVLVALVLMIWGLIYIHSKVSTPTIHYFEDEEINFGKPDENTIRKAVDGILNTEKVEPFYVHAAPRCREVKIVKSRLKETGFAMVSGGPGEGKSMVAYHAAYDFQDKARYCIYALRAERLENKTGKKILDEVLSQLYRLKGRRKLIIVDDAHKLCLSIKKDLNIILQQEAKEGNGKYIWIETEFHEEKQVEIQPDTYIRVNFQGFFGNLLKNLYQSQDPILEKALKGRIEGLDDAIDRVNKGEILDVRQFASFTSRGKERLAQELGDLKDIELLVLFFISVYTVLSGEAELHINYVIGKINDLKFGWLQEDLKRSSVGDIITCLQNRKLIKIYDKSKIDKGYIASRHYDTVRDIIRLSLCNKHLIEDLLVSVKTLLTDEYHKCIYIWIFHLDIGAYATEFDRENKEWLINFVSNLLPEWLKCYPRLLISIKSVAEDIYDEIIENLDIYKIAEKVPSTEIMQFDKIADLLNSIGNRRNELIEKLDLAQLSRTANSAEIWQFGRIAYLLNSIGDRRNELIEKLDLAQFGTQANNANIEKFGQIADLLNSIGDRRDELIEKLDLAQLSRTANSAEICQFDQLANLLRALGNRRDELIEKLDLAQFGTKANNANIEQFVQIPNLLVALGNNRNKLIDKMDLKILAKTSSDLKVKQFKNLAQLLRELEECRNELIKELDFEKLAKSANSAEINEFEQIAGLLNGLGERKSQLLRLLNHDTLVRKAYQAGLYDIMGLTSLIAKLEEEDRSKYIQEVDWSSICLKCPIYFRLLSVLGESLGNLRKQAESTSDRSSIERVVKHLQANADKIKKEIGKTYHKLYSGLAKFLWNCNQVDAILAKQIATETIGKLANTFRIKPTGYRGTGRLITALYAIDPNLSASFVKNKKVRRRIQQSINESDWNKEVEGLKYLIRALYRSVPDLWKKMVSYKWLTVDLSPLDLDLIYKDVDEERNAGTAL